MVWLLSLDTAVIADGFTIPTGLAALPIPTSLDQLPDSEMIPTSWERRLWHLWLDRLRLAGLPVTLNGVNVVLPN